MTKIQSAGLIFINGKITSLDSKYPDATNIAVKDGIIVGVDDEERYERGPETKVIDLNGRRVIPGLNDSHLHVIRGGLNYNMELRWDGVPSLADGLRMLRQQAENTPPGQWVRVVGGWSEFQFKERRMPTLDEINTAAPETPVFILHLYCRALLNGAALRACGYTKDTPNPPGGEIQRDSAGNPTGLLIARPNATILYATLAKGPKLTASHQTGIQQVLRQAGGFSRIIQIVTEHSLMSTPGDSFEQGFQAGPIEVSGTAHQGAMRGNSTPCYAGKSCTRLSRA